MGSEMCIRDRYKISRSLYFYVKKDHVGVIPGIQEYIRAFTSEKSFGPEGYLVDKGLIPLSDAARKDIRTSARGLKNLKM